jgi:acetyl esterase/lipase
MRLFPSGVNKVDNIKGGAMRRPSPQLDAWLGVYNQTLEALLESGFQLTPANARKGLADLTRSLVTDRTAIPWIRNHRVEGPRQDISVRIYHPRPDAQLPVLIYVHGGGHVAGSVEVYDPICRRMAKTVSHIVVSVDYRLAPEHPYPAGIEDVYAVAEGVWPTLDRCGVMYQKQLSIAGDSAGGALCATIAHKARHQPGMQIRHQVLIYPSLDYTMTLPSIKDNGRGYLLEAKRMEWYFNRYFQHDENRRKASPLHMKVFSHLPKTLVITAEFCPLKDEGITYAAQLQSQGVEARHLHFQGMIHAFLNMENLAPKACDRAYNAIGAFLNS